MRDGLDSTSLFWKILRFKWKERKESDVGVTKNPPNENDTILQKGFDIKPLYNTLENEINEPPEKNLKMDDERQPMSFKRKICFVLSFNLWIVYFAAFLWILPCIEQQCPGAKKWSINISNIELTTNIDTIDNMVIFGYRNVTPDDQETRGMVLALNSSNGGILWTDELNGIPLYVECGKNFSNMHTSCLITTASELRLIDSSTGELISNQSSVNVPSKEMAANQLICGLTPTEIMVSKKWPITLDLYRDHLLMLNIHIESLALQNFSLPNLCNHGSLNINPTILNYKDEDHVVFSCASYNKTKFWAISVKDVCTEGNTDTKQTFIYLFSVDYDSENYVQKEIMLIDTGKNCIIISWSNVIVCISKQSLREIWRYELHNKSAVVKYIFHGLFTSNKIENLAVIAQEMNQPVVFLLSLSDGKMSMQSEFFPDTKVESVHFISGLKHLKNDFLLVSVKSLLPSKILSELYSSDASKMYLETENTFYTIDFKKSPQVSELMTATSLKGEAILNTDLDVTLLVIEGSGVLTITTYLLKPWEDVSCQRWNIVI